MVNKSQASVEVGKSVNNSSVHRVTSRTARSVHALAEGSEVFMSDRFQTPDGGYLYVVNNKGSFEIHKASSHEMEMYVRSFAQVDQEGRSQPSQIALREFRNATFIAKIPVPHVTSDSPEADFQERNRVYSKSWEEYKEKYSSND